VPSVLGISIAKRNPRIANCNWSAHRNLLFAICIWQFAIFSITRSDGAGGENLLSQEEAALRAAAGSVADSVVQIRTIGGLDEIEGTTLADGPTTGLIISADGYILSSAFNFVQQPASTLVTLPSGKQAPAELVATDHSRMTVPCCSTGATPASGSGAPRRSRSDSGRPRSTSIA